MVEDKERKEMITEFAQEADTREEKPQRQEKVSEPDFKSEAEEVYQREKNVRFRLE
jgi:hypothetical protein